MSAASPEIRAAVREAAAQLGRDPHDLAHALDLSPAVVADSLAPQWAATVPTRAPKLLPSQVADLRAAFRSRPAGATVQAWCEEQARRLGVGHATIRRAVYGFSTYAPTEGRS